MSDRFKRVIKDASNLTTAINNTVEDDKKEVLPDDKHEASPVVEEQVDQQVVSPIAEAEVVEKTMAE